MLSRNPAEYPYTWYKEGEKTSNGVPSPNGKWGLQFGTHRGNMMSREDDGTIAWEYDSYESCIEAMRKNIADLAISGEFIWYAYALSPQGVRHMLLDGAYYVS